MEHGRTGLVVGPSRAVEGVAGALSDLLDDDDRRLEMGRRARQRAVAEFSYDVLADRLRAGIDGATLRD
mgnify:FL=1